MGRYYRDGIISLVFLAIIFSLLITYWYVVIVLWVIFLIFNHLILNKYYRSLEQADIDNMNGYEFERYVSLVLNSRGFKSQVTKEKGDFGVDVLADKDNIKFAIQVKRQSNKVSQSAIREVVAGQNYYNCEKTIVITNSYFTESAKTLARVNNCELINRDSLAVWIYEFQEKKEVEGATKSDTLKKDLERKIMKIGRIFDNKEKLKKLTLICGILMVLFEVILFVTGFVKAKRLKNSQLNINSHRKMEYQLENKTSNFGQKNNSINNIKLNYKLDGVLYPINTIGNLDNFVVFIDFGRHKPVMFKTVLMFV